MAEPRVEAMRQACQSLSRCVMSLGNALHLRCTPGTDSDVTSIVQHLRSKACNVGRGHTSAHHRGEDCHMALRNTSKRQYST